MKDPQITLTCDCGESASVGYGQRWTCPKCGKSYDTTDIPSSEYGALLVLTKRYRMVSFAIVGVMALIVLAVALTGQTVSIFAGLAVSLLSWFLYIRPLIHRKHKRAVAQLTRSWDVAADEPRGESTVPGTVDSPQAPA